MNKSHNQLYEYVEDMHSRYTTEDFKNKASLIVGKRGVGKTTLAKNIISLTKPDSVVVSGMKDIKGEMNDMSYTKLSPKKDFMEQVNKIVNEKNRGHTLIWIRDMDIFDSGIFKTKTFRNILMNHKLLNLSMIVEIQIGISLTPILRTNFDWIFLAREDYINSQKKNYEHYIGSYPSYSSYKKVNDSLTQFDFLMIKTISFSHLVRDSVSKIRTKQLPPFVNLNVLKLPKEDIIDPKKQNEIKELKNKVIEIRKKLSEVIDRLEVLES